MTINLPYKNIYKTNDIDPTSLKYLTHARSNTPVKFYILNTTQLHWIRLSSTPPKSSSESEH